MPPRHSEGTEPDANPARKNEAPSASNTTRWGASGPPPGSHTTAARRPISLPVFTVSTSREGRMRKYAFPSRSSAERDEKATR